MLTYVKPNGKVMEIDEGSVDFAEKLGWTPKQKEIPKVIPETAPKKTFKKAK